MKLTRRLSAYKHLSIVFDDFVVPYNQPLYFGNKGRQEYCIPSYQTFPYLWPYFQIKLQKQLSIIISHTWNSIPRKTSSHVCKTSFWTTLLQDISYLNAISKTFLELGDRRIFNELKKIFYVLSFFGHKCQNPNQKIHEWKCQNFWKQLLSSIKIKPVRVHFPHC